METMKTHVLKTTLLINQPPFGAPRLSDPLPGRSLLAILRTIIWRGTVTGGYGFGYVSDLRIQARLDIIRMRYASKPSPSGKFLDLLPPASLPPVQKRDAQHMFLQHKGSHTD